jgi:hypothetical protein
MLGSLHIHILCRIYYTKKDKEAAYRSNAKARMLGALGTRLPLSLSLSVSLPLPLSHLLAGSLPIRVRIQTGVPT